jgi:hypothetical protein
MYVTVLLPFACAWARRQESIILRTGMPLVAALADTAIRLGIRDPARIRLLSVAQVPPLHSLLRQVGEKFGIVSDLTIGMTLRYGIFIREDHWGDRRLVVHELAHVAQYERKGGFRQFLNQYLQECLDPGYPFGELELEARRAESAHC